MTSEQTTKPRKMGRPKGSQNKKTLAKIATMKRAAEQGVELSRGPAAKLSAEGVALVVQLVDEGETQAKIAERLGISQGAISKLMSQLQDTRTVAKRKLHASALKLTDIAIAASQLAGETGNAEPALELLDRLEVAPRREVDAGGGGNRVIVVVGQASPNALPSQFSALPGAIVASS